MADKQFIGKVTEKTFNNGGSIIKLSLGEKDKALLTSPGWTNISIKKSTKGNWYAEIDNWDGGQQPLVSQTYDQGTGQIDDLPF